MQRKNSSVHRRILVGRVVVGAASIRAGDFLAVTCRILYSKVVARIIPFTEARASLSELLDEVATRHEHVVITRKGRPVAIVVSAEEWEAVEETLEILQDDEALASLRASEEDVKAGRLFSLDEVRRELGLA